MTRTFNNAFKIVVGEEGGLSTDPADPGNWTSGICGKGRCLGTKFGIAASAHPDLDIPRLMLDQAHEIYKDAYWTPIHGDELPTPLSLLIFDAAVNCGISRSISWLQTALGCPADGVIGPQTLSCLKVESGDGVALYSEVLAQRLIWMTELPTWRVFALGWARRLCRLPYLSLSFGDA